MTAIGAGFACAGFAALIIGALQWWASYAYTGKQRKTLLQWGSVALIAGAFMVGYGTVAALA